MPFTFLLALGIVSVCILSCVNVEKSRHECRRYLEEEAVRLYGFVQREKGETTETLVVGRPEDVDGMVEVIFGKEREGEGERGRGRE
jgi:hypothetical protein